MPAGRNDLFALKAPNKDGITLHALEVDCHLAAAFGHVSAAAGLRAKIVMGVFVSHGRPAKKMSLSMERTISRVI